MTHSVWRKRLLVLVRARLIAWCLGVTWLAGAGASSAQEFEPRSYSPAPTGTTFVIGVTVVPPWGQYQPAQLVNLGFNRWAVKPEVGVSHQIDRWTVDWYAGTWLFTANDNYFPSRAVKQQDPVFAAQTHVSYAFARRSWLAVNATWFCRRSDAHRSRRESR